MPFMIENANEARKQERQKCETTFFFERYQKKVMECREIKVT